MKWRWRRTSWSSGAGTCTSISSRADTRTRSSGRTDPSRSALGAPSSTWRRSARTGPSASSSDRGGIRMRVEELIVDDRDRSVFRYHRSALTSAEIYEHELGLIFDRCWLYLGHESEVAAPGDFRRR